MCFSDMVIQHYSINPPLTRDYRQLISKITGSDSSSLATESDNLGQKYKHRNIVRGGTAVEDGTNACCRAFVQLIYEVVRLTPQWLLSDCECPAVLLTTLLVLLHSETQHLITATTVSADLKALYCSLLHHEVPEGEAQSDCAYCKVEPSALTLCGGRWPLLWRALRVLRMFMTKHMRSGESLSNLPHYSLFCQQLQLLLDQHIDDPDTSEFEKRSYSYIMSLFISRILSHFDCNFY